MKLKIEIYKEKNIYIAECKKLSIFCSADSFFQILKELLSQFIHFRKYYSKIPPEKLTDEAKRIQKLYKQL